MITGYGVPLPTLASVSFSSFFFLFFLLTSLFVLLSLKRILYCEETAGLCENGGTCTNLVGIQLSVHFFFQRFQLLYCHRVSHFFSHRPFNRSCAIQWFVAKLTSTFFLLSISFFPSFFLFLSSRSGTQILFSPHRALPQRSKNNTLCFHF